MKDEKVKITIEPFGKVHQVVTGTPLKDIVLEYGVEFPCDGESYCGGCKVKILSGDVKDSEKHKELNYQLGMEPDYRLACLSEVCEDLTIELTQLKSIILADNSEFTFNPSEGIGIAIDLGTTTIVAQLIDLSNGQVLDVQTSLNPQSRFGSDVMSRVLHGLSESGLDESKQLIRSELNRIIQLMLSNKNYDLRKIVIVGNTVMHHLFCGFDPTPLSRYPFENNHTDTAYFTSSELSWDVGDSIKIIFVKPLGSFIGSDILAGILASGIQAKDNLVALIDLGTNGEIVVGSKEKILYSSTAAGPAFEGANIQMGMSAATGAISSVELNDSKINIHVIGNQNPMGICGSGLIDAVKIFIDNNQVDLGGAIIGDVDKLFLCDNVFVSQKDIREFQLAKAAISAGVQILVNKLGKEISDISQVFIAGGFGNYINLNNVSALGMLEINPYKINKLGNTALIGAKMMLFYDDYSFNDLIPILEHISLDANPDFQEIFAQKMFFSEGTFNSWNTSSLSGEGE